MISSIGLGGGVVAMVQPIHAPMNRIARKAMNTGTATAYNLRVSPARLRLSNSGRMFTCRYSLCCSTALSRMDCRIT